MTSAAMGLPIFEFFSTALANRSVIYAMALHDFKRRYVGTLGGSIWAIAQPLALVAVYYFVFAIGLRVPSPENVPFILWFVGGLVPWFAFNEALTASTSAITNNSYLVKRTIFPTEILPFVPIASGFIPHLTFLAVLGGLLIFFGVPFHFQRLLVVYYFVCMVCLLLGLGWLLSSLQVFYRDIGQALAILLNIWFWATPIVWPESLIPAGYRWVVLYNPMHYVISGYRNTLIYDTVILPSAVATAYFWSITLLILVLGAYVFRRLKPEFADVL